MCLQIMREIADLIQEQGAMISPFYESEFAAHRAGEGAFLIAEQFALNQSGGQGSAINGHKGPARACGTLMNGLGGELFSCAGFAGNKHWSINLRKPADANENFLHRGAFANEKLRRRRAVTFGGDG